MKYAWIDEHRLTYGLAESWDNAPMESFWGTLKTKLVYHCRFISREQAKRVITEYIEVLYNRVRKQARLGFLSPIVFSQRYHLNRRAA